MTKACDSDAPGAQNTGPLPCALPEAQPASSSATSAPAAADFVWQRLEGAMHMQTLKHDYAPVALLELVAPDPRRALDVGCFCGGTGKWLKKKFPHCHVTGIEYLDAAAAIAAKAYDKVINKRFEDVDFDLEGIEQRSLDVVIAADVLEHLYNPWRALQRLRPLVARDGAMYVSLPNIRNLNILKGLVEGRWQYGGSGILDITHIRFFTRAQAVEMLEQTGWRVVAERVNLDPGLAPFLAGKDVATVERIEFDRLKLENLSGKDVQELFTLQFFFKAIPIG